jgi:hypothetical protein
LRKGDSIIFVNSLRAGQDSPFLEKQEGILCKLKGNHKKNPVPLTAYNRDRLNYNGSFPATISEIAT